MKSYFILFQLLIIFILILFILYNMKYGSCYISFLFRNSQPYQNDTFLFQEVSSVLQSLKQLRMPLKIILEFLTFRNPKSLISKKGKVLNLLSEIPFKFIIEFTFQGIQNILGIQTIKIGDLQYQNMQNSRISQLMKQTFIEESIPQFIRKIYELLESNKYENIICWGEDGITLVIKDQKALASQILPNVFNQNTMRSFVRQLNMYEFKKIRKQGNEKQLYFRNKHFVKNNLEELIFIKRKKRGYVEQQSLQVRETKTICERYNIFVYGMLSKLCEVLHLPSSLKQNANLMKFLRSLLQQLTSSRPHFQSYQRLVDNIRTTQNDSYCNDFLRSFKSFKSIDVIPCFKSAFSIFEQSNA